MHFLTFVKTCSLVTVKVACIPRGQQLILVKKTPEQIFLWWEKFHLSPYCLENKGLSRAIKDGFREPVNVLQESNVVRLGIVQT